MLAKYEEDGPFLQYGIVGDVVWCSRSTKEGGWDESFRVVEIESENLSHHAPRGHIEAMQPLPFEYAEI
jgi:hypothetical protein